MRMLKVVLLGWSLFFGVQSALACCKETPTCIHPLTDLATELGDDGKTPPSVQCCLKGTGCCLDACCVWGCGFLCAAPISLCCPSMGTRQKKSRREGVAQIQDQQPTALAPTPAERVEERVAAASLADLARISAALEGNGIGTDA